MRNLIRVLGISPYEGMKNQMLTLAKEYPDLEVTVFVGDMEQGLQIAKNNFHGDYDVVISRGATAKMLRQQLTIPVIEIDISMYDILCAIRLANGMRKNVAMISFADIRSHVLPLCDLLDCTIDTHIVDSLSQVEPLLKSLQEKKYDTLLCDMIVNTTAQRLGINSYLITSGMESIRSAFEQVLLLSESQKNLREENIFFRELIRGQVGQTMVFDQEGTLFLSTLEDPKPELLEILRQELPMDRESGNQRIIRSIKGMRYSIRIQAIMSSSLAYTAFFIEERKLPLPASQMGISYSTKSEAEDIYYSSIFSIAGNLNGLHEEMDQLSQRPLPVIFTGEDGTGKEAVANLIYTKSPLQKNPLITINCGLINEKSWSFLMEHHNSPLVEEGNTLYIQNVDVLPMEKQYQLISVLEEMEVCERNRVMISCVCQSGEYISKVGALFREKLSCLSLYLPPLRHLSQEIPTLLNLSLSRMNLTLPTQILGAENEALSLLKTYEWPYNYTQFRRVLEELAMLVTNQFITADHVSQVLQKERHVGTFNVQEENKVSPLDLNRTLSEISQEIALLVLEETKGNHTETAKRLGISRTTLWRLLQK